MDASTPSIRDRRLFRTRWLPVARRRGLASAGVASVRPRRWPHIGRHAARLTGAMGLVAGAACGSTDPTAPAAGLDPALRDEVGGWQLIAAGDGYTCGLDRAGVPYCWGKNDDGQLGDPSGTPSATPVPLPGGFRFETLVAGSYGACGLSAAGQLYCWRGDKSPRLVDTPVAFQKIALSMRSVCGIAADGSAYCGRPLWSANGFARLPGGHRFVTLTGADTPFTNAYCGVATDGAAYCWSVPIYGDPDTPIASDVVRQAFDPPVAQVVSVGDHGCAVLAQHVAKCVGSNRLWQLGDNSPNSGTVRTTPVAVTGRLRFVALNVAWLRTCGVATTGGAYCWGQIRRDEDVSTLTSSTPTAVLPGVRTASVSVGADHTCFLTPGGAGYCLGENGAGQLGDGTTGDLGRPAVRVLDP